MRYDYRVSGGVMKVFEEKPILVPLCLPSMPYMLLLVWDQTCVSMVRSWWPVARVILWNMMKQHWQWERPGSSSVQVELLSSEQETFWDGSWSSITSISWGTHVGRQGCNAIYKPHISTGLTSGSCTLSCICVLCAPRDSLTGQLSAVVWLYFVILCWNT
jgi:hypothetical protein